MAVLVRLGGRGIPRRMAAASFGIASTPVRATGGLYHRVTASYGTVPQPAKGPPTVRPVSQLSSTVGGDTSGSLANPVYAPTWSIVRPSLPRNAPWAGQIPHGIPGRTYTPALQQGAWLALNARTPSIKPRGPIAQGRVTTAPKPMFNWRRQGSPNTPGTAGV